MNDGQGQFRPEVLVEFFKHVYELDAQLQAQSPGAAHGDLDEAGFARSAPPVGSSHGLPGSAGSAEEELGPGRGKENEEDKSANAEPMTEASDELREAPTSDGGDAPGQRKKRKRQSAPGLGTAGVALPVTKPAQRLCCGLLQLFVEEAVGRAAEQAEVEGSSTIEGPHLERVLPKLLLDF